MFAYLAVGLAMSCYRLLKKQTTTTFTELVVDNAEAIHMIPEGAVHVWIPIGMGTKEALSGWLITPKGKYMLQDEPFPIIVMAHGIGNQKDMGLLKYSAVFNENGYATLMIDYRSFGGSRNNWKIRNYINPFWHVEDIVTTVKFIRENSLGSYNVDKDSIVLWGASFAGGHVIAAAAELGPENVKGVISQAPHLDGNAASWNSIVKRGFFGTIGIIWLASLDYLRGAVGLSPLYVKIISSNSTDISYLTVTPEDLKEYFSKHPKEYLGGWQNKAPVRSVAMMSFYNPIQSVKKLDVTLNHT